MADIKIFIDVQLDNITLQVHANFFTRNLVKLDILIVQEAIKLN